MEPIHRKSLVWVGSSNEDLKKFPKKVQRDVGFALYRAELGKKHHNTKNLKGFRGVMEIVSSYQTNTYRTVYAVKIGENIFVLHSFMKKSKQGIKTPKSELEIIKKRLMKAKELAKEDCND